MKKVVRFLRMFFTAPAQFGLAVLMKVAPIIPDKLYLRIWYRLKLGEKLNLKNPKTFSEKLQWLKLYDRNPVYTTMVDKYAVKQYVADIIGEEYIIPTLGVWNSFDEIDFDKLPNQFVLKTTHGGGGTGVVICSDKKSFNYKEARRKLDESLKRDIYLHYREWPYKNVPKRIIAEKYIVDDRGDELMDYKFFCFNGVPTICYVLANTKNEATIDWFDMEWNHQKFIGSLPVGCPVYMNAKQSIARPSSLDKMIDIAYRLSASIPFLRVDLYNVNGNIFFGETTFYPSAGLWVFTPDEWNIKLGDMIKL